MDNAVNNKLYNLPNNITLMHKDNKNLDYQNNTQMNLNLVHWNCNSLCNKIDEFKIFCNKFNPHIISLNETKMTDDKAKYILQIENYTTIHKSRSNNKNGAGGVALMVRNDIKFCDCTLFNSLKLEICSVNIFLNGKEICIISYYNPPKDEVSEKVFDILKDERIEYILMGDLNAKSTLWTADENNLNGDILNNIIINHDCIIVNNKEPTHINFNGKTKSILDYCIVSNKLSDKFEDFKVCVDEDMTSDHLPYILSLNFDMSNRKIKYSQFAKVNNSYNFNKANWVEFKNCLPLKVDNGIDNNVNKLNKFVCESLISAADSSIPIFNNSVSKQKHLPSYILDLIKARKTARKASRNTTKKDNDCVSSKTLYNKLTNIIRDEINALKDKEWYDFVQKLGKNPPSTKPFWRRINTIKGKHNKSAIPTLKLNNEIYESDEQKASLFASILKQTFSSSNDNKFDEEFKLKVEKTITDHDFSSHNHYNKDIFDLKELNLVIKSLNKKSSNGEDKIHNLMIQNTTKEFRIIILTLINETVKQSNIPQSWKNSVISMIPKKQHNSSNPKDYRPISLTSCIAKLAERLMLKKIKNFMDKNHIIIKQQSGFRKQRQTKDNIFYLTQKAIESINRGKKMCTIFFDIASAFDKVWHDGLIFKLMKLKFPDFIVCWLKEFLTNRYFAVRVNNEVTEKIEIKAGVPQGAVLSPTLFSIFINDIPINYVKNNLYSLLFADDLCSLHI
jgi:hypothetical protein